MTSSMKLKDFGFLGTLPPDEPEKLTLFYDYDYPLMDCPLLLPSSSSFLFELDEACKRDGSRTLHCGSKHACHAPRDNKLLVTLVLGFHQLRQKPFVLKLKLRYSSYLISRHLFFSSTVIIIALSQKKIFNATLLAPIFFFFGVASCCVEKLLM